MSDEKLVRGLGKWDFTAVVINTIIGAGIFGLPARVYAQIGSYSLFAFVVCALVIGLIVLCYAEVSSRFSATGGPYLYAKEAFGSVVGFEVGWLYWIVRVATFAANCNLLITYLGFFVPGASEGSLRIALICLVVGVITTVNLLGIRESAMVTNIFTIGKLLPLLLLAGFGLFFLQPDRFSFGELPSYSSFSSAVLLLLYAYVGFEAAVVLAGETKEPQKTVPIGTLIGLGVVAVVYVLVQVVSIGTVPNLATAERPLADAGTAVFGAVGAAIITVGALVSIFGNLNVGVLSATRMMFAMGEQRELPTVIASTHQRFRTPHVAIFITAGVILVLTVQSSFLTAVAIATITRLLVYATTCVALIVFRRREDMPKAPFTVPLGMAAALVSIGLVVWLLTRVDLAREGLPILAAAVLGLLIFGGYRLTAAKAS
jgi:basic amino acid/polyamine antiporter, APA family